MCAVDLNAELCVAGWSTIAAGVLGGASATHAEHPVSNNSASSRRVGVIAAALCAVVLISGVPMMNVMPRRAVASARPPRPQLRDRAAIHSLPHQPQQQQVCPRR